MTIAFFSAQDYEQPFFNQVTSAQGWNIRYLPAPLTTDTAALAHGCEVVCIFVNDKADAAALVALHQMGVRLLALRCAGYNQVDLEAAKALGMQVARVPAYSPYAVAEHTLALILTLNRRTHKAFNRVREGNFYLGGLLGFDLNGRTVGLIGLGKIGLVTAKIMIGLGCKVLGYDPNVSEEASAMGVQQVTLEELLSSSDIVSLHCPLMPATHHMINEASIRKMKPGVMLINTSRGGLVDTQAVIEGLKSGQIGYLGLDVYEEEAHLFFRDLSERVIQDDVFMRLLSFPNVLITGHQGFFTQDAMENIAVTTAHNIAQYQQGVVLDNAV